jgi:hypothetical protein
MRLCFILHSAFCILHSSGGPVVTAHYGSLRQTLRGAEQEQP